MGGIELPEVLRIKVKNDRDVKLRVMLEPWVDVYALHPGESLDVVVAANTVGELELTLGSNTVVFYAWGGSSLTAQRDGVELDGIET